MNDDERGREIGRLRTQLVEATARKTALASEAAEMAARLPEIRRLPISGALIEK